MSTVEQVREQVSADRLLAGEQPVVVMLSGGRDSVCLLDLAVALCGPERIRALHVNYALRPEAQGDEQHCRELCRALGVSLEAVQASGEERTGNLHAWARQVRYRAATQLAQRLEGEGAHARAVIAVGHTATDQVETILYRLAASPGRRALLGMSAREGRLVRPLLGLTREQTAAYCRERGLGWREDASNDDPRFARARVRHGLLAALQEVHPAALENVLRTARLLREEAELLDGLIEAELADGDGDTVSVERLRSFPGALQRLIVIRLAERAAGTFVPQAGERVEEILTLARRGGRVELHIGGLTAAVVEGGVLRMTRIASRRQRLPRAAVPGAQDTRHGKECGEKAGEAKS